jgi:hypothetical protein
MANIMLATVGVNYVTDGVARFQIPARQDSLTLTSAIRVQGVQDIGTTYEAIDLATVGSDGGPAYFRNLDATNFVELGREIAAAFEAFVKLPPGAGCFLPGVSDKDIFARANTAAVKLEYFICEP